MAATLLRFSQRKLPAGKAPAPTAPFTLSFVEFAGLVRDPATKAMLRPEHCPRWRTCAIPVCPASHGAGRRLNDEALCPIESGRTPDPVPKARDDAFARIGDVLPPE